MAATITHLTRHNCGLCDEALKRLEPWARRLGLEIVPVDVDSDESLARTFGFRIPVFLDARSRVLAEGRIGGAAAAAAALRARVARSPRRTDS